MGGYSFQQQDHSTQLIFNSSEEILNFVNNHHELNDHDNVMLLAAAFELKIIEIISNGNGNDVKTSLTNYSNENENKEFEDELTNIFNKMLIKRIKEDITRLCIKFG